MTTIVGPLPNIISDGQIIDAVPVMNDFNWIVNQVNANGAPNNVNFPLPASGSLINVQKITATGLYTPTTGTNSILMILVGGGGAGGGCPATGAAQVSAGAAGGSGAWVIIRLTAGFSGQTVTIGAGGAAISGGQGAAGGTSQFLTTTVPGGGAGLTNGPATNVSALGGAGGAAPSGSFLISSNGQAGDDAVAGIVTFQPKGGSTPWGSGGRISNGFGFGGGGAGSINGQNQGAGSGFNGAAGGALIYEFA